MTGAKTREEVYQAFELVYPVLQGELTCIMIHLRQYGSLLIISDYRKSF